MGESDAPFLPVCGGERLVDRIVILLKGKKKNQQLSFQSVDSVNAYRFFMFYFSKFPSYFFINLVHHRKNKVCFAKILHGIKSGIAFTRITPT